MRESGRRAASRRRRSSTARRARSERARAKARLASARPRAGYRANPRGAPAQYPRGLARRSTALLPLREPFRAIGQIVIEHGRDAAREFVAHRIVGGIEIVEAAANSRLRAAPSAELAATSRASDNSARRAGPARTANARAPSSRARSAPRAIARDSRTRHSRRCPRCGHVELETAPHGRARHDHGLAREWIAAAHRERGEVIEKRAATSVS